MPNPDPDTRTRERKRTSMTTNRLAMYDTYEITVLTDGKTTVAETTVKGPFGARLAVGHGQSRRRKGDTRNPAVGELLAVARMFESAAKNAREELSALGYGDVA